VVIRSARPRDTLQEERTVADLKHYQDSAGRVFSLTESDARLLGYAPIDVATLRVLAPAAAPGASSELRELRDQVRALQAQLASGASARSTTEAAGAQPRAAGR